MSAFQSTWDTDVHEYRSSWNTDVHEYRSSWDESASEENKQVDPPNAEVALSLIKIQLIGVAVVLLLILATVLPLTFILTGISTNTTATARIAKSFELQSLICGNMKVFESADFSGNDLATLPSMNYNTCCASCLTTAYSLPHYIALLYVSHVYRSLNHKQYVKKKLKKNMYNRTHMLETIYEVDEDLISNDDSLKFTTPRSRLSYYICLCLIAGFFFVVSIIIAISLNPSHLSNISRNLPLSSKDKLKLSNEIINHLDNFSQEINEQLDFHSNRITFFTSTISNSSLDVQNQNTILLIYGHLQYPQSCIDHISCKKKLHSKFELSFTKLSNFLTTIELSSHHEKQIHLDWCNLIDNSATMLLVSLASFKSKNQNTTSDYNVCENIDQHILNSNTTDDLIPLPLSVTVDNQKLKHHNEAHKNSLSSEEEILINYSASKQCSKYTDNNNKNQYERPKHCHHDTSTKYITI
ncbi:unnamed protein product [Rotaria magnacalcarata]|uniref:Uncharacterized protein n=2 Tax=Rotaria magnacalcarata TaxID=392030 RepID=A0A816KQ48_9BILA|nr:unnamed protein product [Rotaria magnacalcarata]